MNAEEIFLAAVEIESVARRRAFLEQTFADHPECRKEVELLLRSHENAGSFLGEPLVSPETASLQNTLADTDLTGSHIGPYLLKQIIGRGGMGVVYRAQQTESVKRQVALKIIRPGISSSNIISRFESERQALAIMDHPNIARVIDAGSTDSGQPYFVMELIKGLPITEYCDKAQLTTQQRLELMVPVCLAVQHAHQKGIIHRDIKPSNILVTEYDGTPVPKIIDFGVARAVGTKLSDLTANTDFGLVVGTLEYMSPEQAGLNQLDIDTRSDVYSLGILLYELLTGSTPLDRKQMNAVAVMEVLRLIRESEPQRPSTRISSTEEAPSVAANRSTEPARLSGLVRGELDWIAMKALDKDRSRRYQTANAFAEDIQRYLQQKPVQAGPPTFRYRLRKMLKRNRILATASALVFLSLMLGAIATTWGWLESRKQFGLANAALVRETDALQAERKARLKADEATSKARKALYALTDEVVQQQLGRSVKLTTEDREFLRKVEKYIADFAEPSDGSDMESAQANQLRAVGNQRIAEIRMALQEMEGANESLQLAAELYQHLSRDMPDRPEYRNEQARCLSHRAIILSRSGDRPAAAALFKESLDLRAALVKEFPDRTDFRDELGLDHLRMAGTLMDQGKNAEAEVQYNQAKVQLTANLEVAPDDAKFQSSLASLHSARGKFLVGLRRHDEAESEYRSAIKLQSVLAKKSANDPAKQQALLLSQKNLGSLLCDLGRFDEGELNLRAGVEAGIRLVTENPVLPNYRQSLGSAYARLGIILFRQKKYDAARIEYESARKIFERIVEQFPDTPQYRLDLTDVLNNLGLLESTLENYDAAELLYQRAVDLMRILASQNPTTLAHRQSLATALNNLGNLYNNQKKFAQADLIMHEALAEKEKLIGDFPDMPMLRVNYGGSCCNYGNLLKASGRFEESLIWYGRAISGIEPAYAANPQSLVPKKYLSNSYFGRATAMTKLKRWVDSLADFRRSRELDDGSLELMITLNEHLCNIHLKQLSPNECSELQKILADEKLSPGDRFNVACVLSAALEHVTDQAEREAAVKQIMEALRNVELAGGFDDPESRAGLDTSEELGPMRDRPEFQEWLKGLGAN